MDVYVICFGGHLFSHLRGPSKAGWRTAAIIHELESEIHIQNSEVYRFQQEDKEQKEVKHTEASYDQSSPTESENHQQQQQDEEEEEESVEQQSPTENNNSDEKEVKPTDNSTTNTTEHSQSKYEQKEKHQYIPRRGGYQNQRGVGRGGRGYLNNGRGGGRRGGRGGNNSGGYQNGPGQPQHYYNDSGYYPRNHYNTRGRGGAGRGGDGNNYHAAAQVELKVCSSNSALERQAACYGW